MASILTNQGLAFMNAKDWDDGAIDYEVMLLKNTYTPNKDHDTVDDINSHEADATSYARIDMVNQTATKDDANDRWDLDADDADFGVMGGATNNTLGYAAIIINNGGADSGNYVCAIIDFASDFTTDGSTPFKVVFNDPLARVVHG